MADVLIVGGGGREHALAWKLAQSKKVKNVFIAPGNGGSSGKLKNVPIGFTDGQKLVEFARKNTIELTVIGQEAASAAGVVDQFHEAGLTIFGPTEAATRVESSKVFSKQLMAKQHVPTAEFKTFSDASSAITYARSRPLPVVVKADGLATGKGVTVGETYEEVETAIHDIMVKKIFGESGNKVVIEDFLKGQEVSVHALCDGTQAVIFPASQDHKQINDGDQGPNTGGMGVIAPVPWVTPKHLETVKKIVVDPILQGLRSARAPFNGCLYPGLMIDKDQITVLEYNARFGDPEAEVYMRLIDTDLYDVLIACTQGNLEPAKVKWKPGYAVSVVISSPGYPGNYKKGLPISGIDAAEALDDIVVFHAATARSDNQLVTAGGRVLNVTATGKSLKEALDKAYAAIKLIHFEGMHYRTDIGRRSSTSS